LRKISRKRDRVELLETFLRYIFGTGKEGLTQTDRRQLAEAVGKPTLEEALSWIQQVKQECLKEGRKAGLKAGRKAGLKAGVHDGIHRSIKQLLRLRFGPLPSATDERLAAMTLDELSEALNRVINAQSVDEVLGGTS